VRINAPVSSILTQFYSGCYSAIGNQFGFKERSSERRWFAAEDLARFNFAADTQKHLWFDGRAMNLDRDRIFDRVMPVYVALKLDLASESLTVQEVPPTCGDMTVHKFNSNYLITSDRPTSARTRLQNWFGSGAHNPRAAGHI
jgi:hypothetical protein